MERLASLGGIFILLGIGYAFSTSRRSINWRVVVVGIALQVYLALFLVRADWVPTMLTVAAAICASLILANRTRPLKGYWAPAARGLGMLGAITTLVWCAVHFNVWWLLLAIPVLPAIWSRIPDIAGVAGNAAIIVAIWQLELPKDFVYQSVNGIGEGVGWLSERALEASDKLFGSYRKGEPGKFVFAINVTAIILMYSALMSVLYHIGLLGWLVGILAKVLRRAMGVTGAESLAAASNVFLGQTEAPLVVRPYLPRMTRSETMALMSGGFATIAGSVLGIYIFFLKDAGFVDGAAHLIAASVMSAPAAFVFAKLFVPETEEPEHEEDELPREELGVNVLDTLAGGVTAGLKLAVNVVAMLLVFYALIDILDLGVNWATEQMFPGKGINFRRLYSYGFAPFAFCMGVTWNDCREVGQLLGTKTIFNEFIAYEELGKLAKAGAIEKRSVVLSTYALCGFANLMSIGIQIAGLSQLAPQKRPVFAQLALKAMIAGALACQLTACIVGVIGRF